LQGKCLLKAQKKMLCEKDTTSQLLTLFVKGGSVARDYEVWNRELAGHRFRLKNFLSHNGRLISHDGAYFALTGEVWINYLHDATHNFVMLIA